MKRSFIITIDTESDNQWDINKSQTTLNARYIPRFQLLCEKYKFKPVYLVDYSMAQDSFLVEYLVDCLKRDSCEVGMHLHAWDTPPTHDYDNLSDKRPYLIEYPEIIMEEKIKKIHALLEDKFGQIISHRAGRWAMNKIYYEILSQLGYKVDCSVTPGVNWNTTYGAVVGGPDYSKETDEAHWANDSHTILEVPMTIQRFHYLDLHTANGTKKKVKEAAKFVLGRNVWLRPALSTNENMKKILKNRKMDYAEFMMHSSELMPGGSPYFQDEKAIDVMYDRLEELFEYAKEDYKGQTLKEYYLSYMEKNPI